MFNFIIYGLGSLSIYIFICFDGYNIVKNNFINKYKNFKRINSLVSTNYKGFFTVFWISICMILKVLWLNIIQYMNSSVVHIQGNTYRITYVIKGKLYQMIVKQNRGPSKILLVSDENEEDISHLICPYLGPEDNFHGCNYTPKTFNKKEILIQLSNGDERIFNEEQVIRIN
jgi:hypothetical protein